MTDNHHPDSILSILEHHAHVRGDAIAIRFLENGDIEKTSMSYRELHQRAKQLAHDLRAQCEKGDRVILWYPQGTEFVISFFACMYAGLIPVPYAYSTVTLNEVQQKRILSVMDDCGATLILSQHDFLNDPEWMIQSFLNRPEITLVYTDRMTNTTTHTMDIHGFSLDQDLAYLQYTSGSSTNPKGVEISHQNIMANQATITNVFGHEIGLSVASWLPHFHDMGLIGSILNPLYVGGTCILFSPQSFLHRPENWLKIISKYHVHTSGGPSFAFDLCNKRIQPHKISDVDLSSWKIAFNGSEPINPKVLDTFAEKFAPFGFSKMAFLPCYGMAEATLIVSGRKTAPICQVLEVDSDALARNQIKPKSNPEKPDTCIVSCGQVVDCEIRIVDPETTSEVPQNIIGEIWLKSPSIARGYWNKPIETKEVFEAYPKDSQAGPYFRTGDLGFQDENQELWITGRIKELIKLRGSNYYPQDLESTVSRYLHDFRSQSTVAFSILNQNREKLVIVQGVTRQQMSLPLEETAKTLRNTLQDKHGIEPDHVIFTLVKNIPRTTSGKLQRIQLRQTYQQGQLNKIYEWTKVSRL